MTQNETDLLLAKISAEVANSEALLKIRTAFDYLDLHERIPVTV